MGRLSQRNVHVHAVIQSWRYAIQYPRDGMWLSHMRPFLDALTQTADIPVSLGK